MVWFLSEAAFSAGSKSAAALRMNFNWQNWSVRWCGSWTLRQSDTMIRTQAERNLHLSLSLSFKTLYRIIHFSSDFWRLGQWQYITLSLSIYPLFFIKFRVACPFFPTSCPQGTFMLPGHFLMAEDAKLMTEDPVIMCRDESLNWQWQRHRKCSELRSGRPNLKTARMHTGLCGTKTQRFVWSRPIDRALMRL